MGPSGKEEASRIIGRYALHGVIAKGGMASVHLGRALGLAGFARTVAVKRLHPNYARDPEFVSMLIDEARLAARIRHPNVVATLDVVALEGELLLVMEYVHGESLSRLYTAARRRGERVPEHVLMTIMAGVLYGLHAAHEAKNDRGEHFDLVHRDVSPQNIQVGVDGVARVLDFGIAKAAGRLQDTREDQLKGRLRYMAPEQLLPDGRVDRRADIYAASAVLWQCLTGKALFKAENDFQMAHLIMDGATTKPSSIQPRIRPELDDLVMCGLAREPADRFPTAYDMAVAIEQVGPLATPREVGQWVEEVAAEALADRSACVESVEGRGASVPPPPPISVSVAGDVRRESFDSASSVPSMSPSPTTRDASAPAPTLPHGRTGKRSRAAGFVLGSAALAAIVVLGASWVLAPSPLRALPFLGGWSSGAMLQMIAERPAPPATTAPEPPAPIASATTTTAPPPTPAATKPRRVAGKPPKPNCNPPYSFDANGVKHLKRECL